MQWLTVTHLQRTCFRDNAFLPESDYVTFGSLLSQIVCRL